jgi:hypothetical protein
VATNVFVRDLNVDEGAVDGRRLEVVANGLPLWGGAQLAVDTTLVSPLRRNGEARRLAATEPGVALRAARRDKERTYPELVIGRRCRLVVLAFEVGGRWSEEAASFVRLLARAKARSAPELLRASVARAWAARWANHLSCAAQRAFATSLLELPLANENNVDGEPPPLGDLLSDCRWEEQPRPSRLR